MIFYYIRHGDPIYDPDSLQSTGCVGFGSLMHGLSSFCFWTLEHRLNCCGAWAQSLHDVWDPPRLGIAPVSPALAGGFLTTEAPEKPQKHF